MRLVEIAQRHRIAAGALAGLVVGTVLGLAQPIRASAPDPAELAAWTPYDRASLQRYDEAMFAKVRDRAIWGGVQAGPGGTAVSRNAQWRLAAIVRAPQPVALVYAEGNTTPLRLQAGDALPDGGKVIEVTGRSIRFERAGCEYERALYSAVDTAAAACGGQQ